MQWLNNPWAVGIIGGVLSGFFVTIITRKLFSKKDNREYLQKLYSANRELIFALRPGVAEGVIPSKKVVELVTNATARKYEVESKDLFGPEQVAEELVKEIMDSSFISSSTKEDYCNKLEGLTRDNGQGSGSEPYGKRYETESKSYRSKMTATMSMTLGVTTALFSFVFFIFDRKFNAIDFDKFSSAYWSFLLPIGVSILAAGLSTLLYSIVKKEKLEKHDKLIRSVQSVSIVRREALKNDSEREEKATEIS